MLFRPSLPSSRSHCRGVTLVEVLIVLAIFSILMTAIFGVFRMGLNAWHQTATKNELSRQLQILSIKLTKDAEQSAIESVTTDDLDGDTDPMDATNHFIASFISPVNRDGFFESTDRGRPEWQMYIIYYLDPAEGIVYRRELDIPAGSAQARSATPIESFNSGSGPQPLPSYVTASLPLLRPPKPVARFVTDFRVDSFPAPLSQLEWQITVQKTRYGRDSSAPEILRTTAATHMRN